MEFALEYKVKQSKNGKFPSHYKLAQSILKCKFPSVLSPSEHKPLKKKSPSKRAFEKYKLQGLFLEFYPNSILTSTTGSETRHF